MRKPGAARASDRLLHSIVVQIERPAGGWLRAENHPHSQAKRPAEQQDQERHEPSWLTAPFRVSVDPNSAPKIQDQDAADQGSWQKGENYWFHTMLGLSRVNMTTGRFPTSPQA
jgi:hypothetical protein